VELGLKGKVAVVTGAAHGIGAATAAAFCKDGAAVLVADIDGPAAQRTAAALAAGGGTAVALAVDVTDEASVAAMVQVVLERFGALHVLVNNAGFTRDKRITRMPVEDWDAVVDVVLKGAFLCSRAALAPMAEQNFGRIINISSRAHLGNPGQANYSAAKAGLLGFTRALALEQGRHHVTVNAVAPGIIDTEAVRRLPHFEKVKEAAEKTTPIPRMGVVEDIADTVLYLASERAGYITGEVVHVTGGRY